MPSPKKSRKVSRKVSRKDSKKKSHKKSSKYSKPFYTNNRCQGLLKKKISINMKEYNAGKFVSRPQAVAVSYSQVRKSFPRCNKFIRSKSPKSSKRVKKVSRKTSKKTSKKRSYRFEYEP